jgi:hypothetical protein
MIPRRLITGNPDAGLYTLRRRYLTGRWETVDVNVSDAPDPVQKVWRELFQACYDTSTYKPRSEAMPPHVEGAWNRLFDNLLSEATKGTHEAVN